MAKFDYDKFRSSMSKYPCGGRVKRAEGGSVDDPVSQTVSEMKEIQRVKEATDQNRPSGLRIPTQARANFEEFWKQQKKEHPDWWKER